MKKSSLFVLLTIVVFPGYGQHNVKLNVEQPPKLEANAGSDKTIEKGESIQLGGNPTAQGGSGFYYYDWSPVNSLDSSNVSEPIATPSDTTDYILVVEDENQCKAKDTIRVNVITSTSIKGMVNNRFLIYPNPAKERLVIEFSQKVNSQYQIELLDLSGKVLISDKIECSKANRIRLPVSDLQQGVYIVKIHNDQDSESKRIVITR